MSHELNVLVSQHGLLGVFVLMVLESACIPIPSEAVVTYAGYQSFLGNLSFWGIVVSATIANLVGSLIAYAVGYYGGRPFILRLGRYVLLNEKHLARAEHWFKRHGEITVFVTRLLPALRTFISLPAGVGRMKLTRFIAYTLLGALPWNYALTLTGFKLGQHWEQITHVIKPVTYAAALVLVGALVWWWLGRRKEGDSSSTA